MRLPQLHVCTYSHASLLYLALRASDDELDLFSEPVTDDLLLGSGEKMNPIISSKTIRRRTSNNFFDSAANDELEFGLSFEINGCV